jgi:translation elongation factor EF-Tu-like GTPase
MIITRILHGVLSAYIDDMSNMDDFQGDQKRLLRELLARGEPHFVVRMTLVKTEDGGRQVRIMHGYRPQLWIGQRLASGDMVHWDSRLYPHGARGIKPGETGKVLMFLLSLPPAVLQVGEHLEFFEGQRRVAIGEVLSTVNLP